MDKRVMTLAAAAAVVLSAVAMPKNPQAAERWFDDLFVQPETLPVTFTYADQGRCGLGGLPVLARHVDETENGKKGRLVCRLDDEMSVTLEAAWCREFNEVEYTLWFANTGKQPTKTLKDIFVYRGFVDGTRPRLRGSLGDHENFYAAYDSDLEREPRTFISTNGRATRTRDAYRLPLFQFRAWQRRHADGAWLGRHVVGRFSRDAQRDRGHGEHVSGFRSVPAAGGTGTDRSRCPAPV